MLLAQDKKKKCMSSRWELTDENYSSWSKIFFLCSTLGTSLNLSRVFIYLYFFVVTKDAWSNGISVDTIIKRRLQFNCNTTKRDVSHVNIVNGQCRSQSPSNSTFFRYVTVYGLRFSSRIRIFFLSTLTTFWRSFFLYSDWLSSYFIPNRNEIKNGASREHCGVTRRCIQQLSLLQYLSITVFKYNDVEI